MWFDPATCVSCLQRYNRCLRCAQESLHSSTIPTGQRQLLGLQLFPNGSAKEEQLLESWRDLREGRWTEPLDPPVLWKCFSWSTGLSGTMMSTRAQHMMRGSILPLGRHSCSSWVGVGEETVQFAEPERGISNRKGGQRRGVDWVCAIWNVNYFDSISLTGSRQVEVWCHKYLQQEVIFKHDVCCMEYILFLNTDSILKLFLCSYHYKSWLPILNKAQSSCCLGATC